MSTERRVLLGVLVLVTAVLFWLSECYRVDDLFVVNVFDVDKSLSYRIESAKFDWYNDEITEESFPKGFPDYIAGQRLLKLYKCGGDCNSEYVLQLMRADKSRPATIRELLLFAEKYPHEQRKYDIVALGSISRDSPLPPKVAYLDILDHKRRLRWDLWEGYWPSDTRFLAISVD